MIAPAFARGFGAAGPRGPWLATAVVVATLSAATVSAQTPLPDPDAEANIRLGPLSLKSTIAVSNMGVDTNVFNEADADQPESDFTVTFSPNTDVWLRVGRTWITGAVQVDWVYYNEFASERGTNAAFRIGVDRTFNRLAVKANARHLTTRDRPGFEIDARSQRLETQYDGEATVRVSGKTSVGATGFRRRTDFAADAIFREADLSRELDRTTSGTGFVVRNALTPLTSLALDVTRERERFVTSQFRDSDSTKVMGSVAFQPLALINGTASAGVRVFDPVPADVPAFNGVITAVNLSYSLLGVTRFGVQATRDIQYSFEFTQPYYLESGVTGTVQQQIFGPFDLLARIGTRGLAYADRIGAAVAVSNRTDRVNTIGAGAGYRMGIDKRLGFTLERQHRTSTIPGRNYTGLRFGLSLTYET